MSTLSSEKPTHIFTHVHRDSDYTDVYATRDALKKYGRFGCVRKVWHVLRDRTNGGLEVLIAHSARRARHFIVLDGPGFDRL